MRVREGRPVELSQHLQRVEEGGLSLQQFLQHHTAGREEGRGAILSYDIHRHSSLYCKGGYWHRAKLTSRLVDVLSHTHTPTPSHPHLPEALGHPPLARQRAVGEVHSLSLPINHVLLFRAGGFNGTGPRPRLGLRLKLRLRLTA